MKQIIQKILSKLGFRLVRNSASHREKSQFGNENNKGAAMDGALKRLKRINIELDTVVDIGAAKGTWTIKALRHWPNARYELVEPIKEQIDGLVPILKKSPNINIIEAVAGRDNGTVELTITQDLDGSGIYGGKGSNTRDVRIVKVDSLMSEFNRKVLLKLDTHGYEIPIFEGAKDTLKRTEVIIVEVYGFQVSPTGKLFHELSAYLENKGFRLFDIVDVMRRPGDHVFWQADAVYLSSNHPVFSSNSYHLD